MTENAIIKAGSTNIVRTMDDAERAARAMSASGFFADTKQASQAIVKILAGQELGFGPFASMTGVHIIKEKPTLAANLMAAAVKRSGKYNYKVVKHDENECHLEFYELWGGKWEKVGDSVFTIADAKKAGVYESNPNWKKYPRNQLFARAISNGQKWYAPDAFNGATVYTPDEMGAAVDEEGNVIEAKAEPVADPTNGNPEPIDDAAWKKWTDLCARADELSIQHPNPNRETTLKAELRAAYIELNGYVKDAIEQEAAIQPA
jgi:hypothetical protein